MLAPFTQWVFVTCICGRQLHIVIFLILRTTTVCSSCMHQTDVVWMSLSDNSPFKQTWFFPFNTRTLVTRPNGIPRWMTSASVTSLGMFRMWMTFDGGLGDDWSSRTLLASLLLRPFMLLSAPLAPLDGVPAKHGPLIYLYRQLPFAHRPTTADQLCINWRPTYTMWPKYLDEKRGE